MNPQILELGLKVSAHSFLGLYYTNRISLERYLKGDQNPFKTFKNPLEEPEIQAPRTNLKK